MGAVVKENAGQVVIVDIGALGQPSFTGRTSDIFEWEHGRMLKLFFPEIGRHLCELEYLNTREAHSKGCTALDAHGMVACGDRHGIILDRIPGEAMSRLADKSPWLILTVHKDIADLQMGINNKHTDSLENYTDRIRANLGSVELDFLSDAEREELSRRVDRLPEGDHLLHLDFHTENVLHHQRENVIIDWMTAARGLPAADIASTWFLFTDSELSPTMTEGQKRFYNSIRRFIVKRYRRYYQQAAGVANQDVEDWLLPTYVMRLCAWQIDSERPVLQRSIRAELAKPSV
jgi:hypothetical protein